MAAPPPLDDLALFVAVARERSFSRAAAALGLPKSTLSRRVAALEQRIGAALLHRTTRSLSLTSLGAAHVERCAAIVAAAEEAARALEAGRQAPRGRLRVAAPVLFGAAFLADAVADFVRLYPGTAVDLVVTDSPVDVIADGFDIVIRVDRRLPDSSSLARRFIGPAPMAMVASPRYLDRRGLPRRPADLVHQDCILLGDGPSAARWELERGSARQIVKVAGRVRVSSPIAARELALAGAGIAIAPLFLCAAPLAAGTLRLVLEGWSITPYRIHALYGRARPTAGVRALLDLVAARGLERARLA